MPTSKARRIHRASPPSNTPHAPVMDACARAFRTITVILNALRAKNPQGKETLRALCKEANDPGVWAAVCSVWMPENAACVLELCDAALGVPWLCPPGSEMSIAWNYIRAVCAHFQTSSDAPNIPEYQIRRTVSRRC